MIWWQRIDVLSPHRYRTMVPSILQMCCLQENGVRFEYSSGTLTQTNEFACFFYSRMFGFLIYNCKIIENFSIDFFYLVIIMNVVTLTIEGGVEFHTLIEGFCFSRWPMYDNRCVDFSSPSGAESSSFLFSSPVVRLSVYFSHILTGRTIESISTKLGTMPPWVKGIQVFTNESAATPFSKGR